MPDIVLDNSAAGKLFRDETNHEQLRKWLLDETSKGAKMHVPPVFPFELRNVVAKTVKEGLLGLGDKTYERIMGSVIIAPDDSEGDVQGALRWGLTTHDAAYVRLAGPGRVLVTYDEPMAKAAVKAGIVVVAP